MSKEYKSFGEYFDTQRDRIVKAMQNKNTELHKAWREDYDKRQAKKQELSLLKKMAPVGPKEKKLLKEMVDAINKGINAKEKIQE